VSEKTEALRKDAWSWLKPVQMIHLATWDGTFPRVRPVSLIFDQGRFWFCTGTNDAKVRQIRQHPVFEFSLILQGDGTSGTLRCCGRTRISDDIEEKSIMASRIPFFSQYWDYPEDPTYCLVELLVEDAEYMKPGEMIASSFSV